MRSVKIIAALLCLFVLAVATGCHRRPLLEPDNRAVLQVKINYLGIKNVTTGIYNEKVPTPEFHTDVMRVLFYNEDGTRLLSEGFISDKEVDEEGNEIMSGNIMLAHGNYRMLAYNFDTPSTFIRGEEQWDGITAYTQEIPESKHRNLCSRALADERIYYEPDQLFVVSEPNLKIDAHSDITTINVEATPIVETYYIQIRVENMEYASSAVAVLTGLSATNAIGENTRNSEESSALYIELHKSTDENIEGENKDVLCGVFNTFGRVEDAPSNLYITMQAMTREGEYAEKTIDMTSVFLTEDARERHWLLIEDVWELPVPINPPGGGGGGFAPEVDDWDDEEVIIPIS